MRNPFAKIQIDSLLFLNGVIVVCALVAVNVKETYLRTS